MLGLGPGLGLLRLLTLAGLSGLFIAVVMVLTLRLLGVDGVVAAAVVPVGLDPDDGRKELFCEVTRRASPSMPWTHASFSGVSCEVDGRDCVEEEIRVLGFLRLRADFGPAAPSGV